MLVGVIFTVGRFTELLLISALKADLLADCVMCFSVDMTFRAHARGKQVLVQMI